MSNAQGHKTIANNCELLLIMVSWLIIISSASSPNISWVNWTVKAAIVHVHKGTNMLPYAQALLLCLKGTGSQYLINDWIIIATPNVMWLSRMSYNSQVLILRYSQAKQMISLFPSVFCSPSTTCLFGTNWPNSMGSVVKCSFANDVQAIRKMKIESDQLQNHFAWLHHKLFFED